MNPTEELTVESDNTVYSRSQRRVSVDTEEKDSPDVSKQSFSIKVKGSHKLQLLLWSVVVGCLSVAVPLLLDTATSLQSQNLYIGMMFSKGQLPYTDMFATGGFIYYVLIALAYYLGSSLWLVPIQILAFYISGIYFYKLVTYFCQQSDLTKAACALFYLLNLILGFGGLYPVQFAMPFVLIALWFLTKYFAGLVADEAFILYGFTGALAMLIEPRTLVFWLLSFATILIYNLGKRHIARGFYQLLCIIFGTILVFYTAGYFIINLQILSAYIAQAVVYQFTYYATASHSLLLTIPYQLAVAFGVGLLLGAILVAKVLQNGKDRLIKWFLFIVFLAYLVIACLSQSFELYHLLPLLPFGLLLTVQVINSWYQESVSKSSRRRVKPRRKTGVLLYFLRCHVYLLPIIGIVAIGGTVVETLFSTTVNTERSQIASYLTEEASDEEIYVWDDLATIYLKSGLVSSSQFSLPTVNTTKSTNAKVLEDELLQNVATYVVVNTSESLSSTVLENLENHYEVVELDNVSHFTIYQKK